MTEDSTPKNTSDLATRLEKKKAEDRRQIEAILNDNELSLKRLLNDCVKQIENDTANLRMETRSLIRESVSQMVWPLAMIWAITLTGVLFGLIATGWVAWQTDTITAQHDQIQKLRRKHQALTNIQVRPCGQRMCVKIQPGKKYGPNNDYRIIQPQQ